MKTILALSLLPVTVVLLLSGRPVRAQVEIDLQHPVQFGASGSTFQFYGTITNYGAAPIYITGDTFTSLAPGLTLDDSPSNNTPALLSAFGTETDSYTGELFDVTSAAGTPTGPYSGTFSLTGGADPIANYSDTLVTKHFGVTLAPVPEASTTVSLALMLALGVGGLVRTVRRKKTVSAD